MLFPYPERISYAWATTFASILFAVQVLEHTEILFALCCFTFILLATAGFNIAGGLYRPAGAYIFFNAVLTLIVGIVVKAVLGEPGQTHLAQPDHTIEAYLFGMLGMLLGACVERYFRPRKSLIEKHFPMPDLRSAYVGAIVLALSLKVFYIFGGVGILSGQALITLYNSDKFLPFALILGVMYTIRSSNGRRSMTPFLAVLFFLSASEGLISFSKQAFLSPPVCWALGAAVCRYRLKFINIAALALVSYVAYAYVTPYSQYGRNFKTANTAENVRVSIELLTHIDEVVRANAENAAAVYGDFAYYNHSVGLFDRLQMLSIDDALVAETDHYGLEGLEPLKESVENLVPHILWPDKPFPYFGNYYAHEIGAITDEDNSTSVSFGVSADFYHQAGFAGVLLIQPFCMIAVFLIFSFLLGDVRGHPAVLVAILLCAHIAPEGAVTGLFYLVTVAEYMVILAIACKYVLPVVSSIVGRSSAKAAPSTLPLLSA